MFDQVFDDFEVSVEASCSQGGRVCLCGWVDICPALNQQSDNFQVTCCSNCIRQAIWQCSRSPVSPSPGSTPPSPSPGGLTCSSSTPEWWCSLNGFPVKGNTARLLHRYLCSRPDQKKIKNQKPAPLRRNTCPPGTPPPRGDHSCRRRQVRLMF